MIALAVAVCSCSATITEMNGETHDGELTGWNSSKLFYRDSDGRKRSVPTCEVADIDHPGNVVGTIGSVMAAIFIPACGIAIGYDLDKGKSIAEPGVGVGCGYAAISIALAAAGWAEYYRSRSAVKGFTPDRGTPLDEPGALPPNLPGPGSPPGLPDSGRALSLPPTSDDANDETE